MAGELSTPREAEVGSRGTGDTSSALKHLVEESERTKLLLSSQTRSSVPTEGRSVCGLLIVTGALSL